VCEGVHRVREPPVFRFSSITCFTRLQVRFASSRSCVDAKKYDGAKVTSLSEVGRDADARDQLTLRATGSTCLRQFFSLCAANEA